MITKLGLQLFTIRNTMNNAENIRMSFKRMKEMGYDEGQTAGCAVPYAEFGQIAKEEGIAICGTHDDFGLMVSDPAKAMENHKALGTTNMGIGGFCPKDEQEVRDFIKQANAVGDAIAPYGFKFTYHNHSHEFSRLPGGYTIMDMLVDGLNPKTTSFVLDTYWVQHGGADIRYWLKKLEGRIDILHLKDMGRDGNGPFITEIGNGNIWWEGVLATAEEIGVKHFVVEQDVWPGDPFDSIRASSEYIHKHFMK